MLAAECGDPEIVGGNRLALALEFEADLRVVMRGRLLNVQHCAVIEQPCQPVFVARPMTGLGDAVAVLADNDYRNRYLFGAGENGRYATVVVG